MVMPNIDSYILAVGLKGPLGLDFLIIGEAIMEVYIAKITVAIHKNLMHCSATWYVYPSVGQ